MNKLFAKPHFVIGILLQLFFALAPNVSLAFIPMPGITGINNPTDFTRVVVCQIAAWMFYVLMALVVIFLIMAAYKYLTSSGDPTKVHEATNMILYAVIAIVVALLAKSIPLIVVNFFQGNLSSVTIDQLFCR